MAKKKSKDKSLTETGHDIDFETALSEVESIVDTLENGEANLSESLQHYETGIKRLKQCHDLLHQAERRVTVLSGFDADGNPVTENFDVDEMESLETKQKARSQRRSGGASKPRKQSTKGHTAAEGNESSVDDTPGLF